MANRIKNPDFSKPERLVKIFASEVSEEKDAKKLRFRDFLSREKSVWDDRKSKYPLSKGVVSFVGGGGVVAQNRSGSPACPYQRFEDLMFGSRDLRPATY